MYLGVFEGDGVSDLFKALIKIVRKNMKMCFIWMFVLEVLTYTMFRHLACSLLTDYHKLDAYLNYIMKSESTK
jgi:hypothetical protein